ncbi:MAG: ABC transporter permease [Cyclobacteriaceae bacterium]
MLKGQKGSSFGSASLRKVLVVAQFAIFITMVISTWVVYDQLQFIRSKDLGFDKNHVVTVRMSEEETQRNFEVLRNSLLSVPQVQQVASSSAKPGQGIGKVIMNVENEGQGSQEKGVNLFFADYDIADALGLKMVQGQNFSRDFASDTAAFYFMDNWLQSFVYQTDIRLISFLTSALLTLLITILMVEFHTFREANNDQVNSLRDA